MLLPLLGLKTQLYQRNSGSFLVSFWFKRSPDLLTTSLKITRLVTKILGRLFSVEILFKDLSHN